MSPDTHDQATKQIQSKLGNYSLIKLHLRKSPEKLLGIERVPASITPVRERPSSSRITPSSQEFKKRSGVRTSALSSTSSALMTSVCTSSASTSTQQQPPLPRSNFVKPVNKLPYNRFSGQSIRHGGSISTSSSSSSNNAPSGSSESSGSSGSGDHSINKLMTCNPAISGTGDLNANPPNIMQGAGARLPMLHKVSCHFLLINLSYCSIVRLFSYSRRNY